MEGFWVLFYFFLLSSSFDRENSGPVRSSRVINKLLMKNRPENKSEKSKNSLKIKDIYLHAGAIEEKEQKVLAGHRLWGQGFWWLSVSLYLSLTQLEKMKDDHTWYKQIQIQIEYRHLNTPNIRHSVICGFATLKCVLWTYKSWSRARAWQSTNTQVSISRSESVSEWNLNLICISTCMKYTKRRYEYRFVSNNPNMFTSPDLISNLNMLLGPLLQFRARRFPGRVPNG